MPRSVDYVASPYRAPILRLRGPAISRAVRSPARPSREDTVLSITAAPWPLDHSQVMPVNTRDCRGSVDYMRPLSCFA